jgi:acylphosphatase
VSYPRTSETTSPNRRVRLLIRGRVQGVGFRVSARREGQRLGIDLTARNLDDGSVQIDAAGSPESIDDLIAWAHHGPPQARVDTVDVSEDVQP